MWHLYTKPDCPFCVSAKRLLGEYGANWEESVVGEDISSEDYRKMVPGFVTVPGIWHEGMFIGGFSELEKFLA